MSKTLMGDFSYDLLSQNRVKLIEFLSVYNIIRYPNNEQT